MKISPSSSSPTNSTWEEDAVQDRVVREKIKADLLEVASSTPEGRKM
jgi:hypothetical protein